MVVCTSSPSTTTSVGRPATSGAGGAEGSEVFALAKPSASSKF